MIRKFAAVAALALAGAGPNWGETITTGADGAYVIGNPQAKVRVVEYLSYTCPHCAHLVAEGGPLMKRQYAASGKVAVEFRNAVRDRLDYVMAVAARCGGPAKFVGNNEALFAAQGKIFQDANAWQARVKLSDKTPINTQLMSLASGAGLPAVMAKRGITPKQLNACIVSKPIQDTVLAMTNEAWKTRNVPYTPYVLVNGAEAGSTWKEVEPAIQTALARP